MLGQEYNPRNCPIIFDAWSCCNATQPGQIQLEKCPDFVNMGFRAERLAKKVCTEEGEWWVHPDTNRLHKNKLYEFLYFFRDHGQTTQTVLTLWMLTSAPPSTTSQSSVYQSRWQLWFCPFSYSSLSPHSSVQETPFTRTCSPPWLSIIQLGFFNIKFTLNRLQS